MWVAWLRRMSAPRPDVAHKVSRSHQPAQFNLTSLLENVSKEVLPFVPIKEVFVRPHTKPAENFEKWEQLSQVRENGRRFQDPTNRPKSTSPLFLRIPSHPYPRWFYLSFPSKRFSSAHRKLAEKMEQLSQIKGKNCRRFDLTEGLMCQLIRSLGNEPRCPIVLKGLSFKVFLR